LYPQNLQGFEPSSAATRHWVRSPGRIARGDVTKGDARRVRAMDGPNQSLSLRHIQTTRLLAGFLYPQNLQIQR